MNSILYIFLLVLLPIIDSIWLFSMSSFYKKWLGYIFAPSFNFIPAALFYIIYAFAILYFIVSPAIKSGTSLWVVCFSGILLGLAAYGAYDLTNQASIKDWPIVVTIIDMAWGALMTGVASVIAVAVFNYFK